MATHIPIASCVHAELGLVTFAMKEYTSILDHCIIQIIHRLSTPTDVANLGGISKLILLHLTS